MPMSEPATRLTTADLLAFPDNDGVERWLIDGVLREKPVSTRHRLHCKIMATLSCILRNWVDTLRVPRGEVLCGPVGVILERGPDTTIGIDVVYVSPEVAANVADETAFINGIPSLVVEILSPHDTQKEIDEKTDKYLAVGIPHIWIIDSHDRTVLVHRPGELPKLFTVRDELTAEPELPGFRTAVSRIFE